jgi:hypothetical protein
VKPSEPYDVESPDGAAVVFALGADGVGDAVTDGVLGLSGGDSSSAQPLNRAAAATTARVDRTNLINASLAALPR